MQYQITANRFPPCDGLESSLAIYLTEMEVYMFALEPTKLRSFLRSPDFNS